MEKEIQFIFLRGLNRESKHWEESFIEKIKKKFPNNRCMTLDYPGVGVYADKKAPLKIKGNVEHIRSIIKLDPNHQKTNFTILISISMGGMIATEWSLLYPDEIQGCVLINSSMGHLSPFYKRLRPRNYLAALKAKLFSGITEKEKFELELVSNNTEKHQEILKKWINIQNLRPMTVNNSIRQLISAATYSPRGQKPGPPLLILKGAGDRLVSPDCSDHINREWGGEMQTHQTGGHELTIDDEDWCVTQISNWVTRIKN